jgi:hypothetical protein
MAEILRVDFHSGEVFNKPARGAAKREHPSSKAGQLDYQTLTPEELDHSTLRRTAVVLRQ